MRDEYDIFEDEDEEEEDVIYDWESVPVSGWCNCEYMEQFSQSDFI
jgi:hypothetical protein